MKKVARPIIQCDMNGNTIKRFPSLYQACKELEIREGAAYYALNSGSPFAKKWLFKYADQVKKIVPEPELATSIDFKPVEQDSYDCEKLTDSTIDEYSMFNVEKINQCPAELESIDRWATPFERILKRREE